MGTQETNLYVVALIVAGVLGIILVYFIVTIIRHHKKHLLLQQEKLNAEIVTLEKERKRIAHDLHDELGPHLSAVRLKIGCLNTTDPEDLALVSVSNDHIDTMLHRLREISNDLMPQVLVRKGLVPALHEFIDKINDGSRLQVTFNSNDISLSLQEAEIHVYRIAQEITHNSIKHSGATLIELSLKGDNEKLIFMARDNGKGFDFENMLRNSHGFGLNNLMNRIRILHGDVQVNSKPGRGTEYSIQIPL